MRGLVLALLFLVSGLPSFASGSPPTGPITEFEWRAPAAYDGTLALKLLFLPAEGDRCGIEAKATGRITPHGSIHLWLEDNEGSAVIGGQDWIAHTHVGDVVDSRTVTSADGWMWGDFASFGGPRTEYWVVTIAAFELARWPDDIQHIPGALPEPLIVRGHCDHPFYLSVLDAGAEGVAFTANSLQGGVGASVGFPGPSLQAADRTTFTITEPKATLVVRHFDGAADLLLVQSPNGSMGGGASFGGIGGVAGSDRLDETGQAGRYEITAVSATPPRQTPFYGMLVGWGPVESLDGFRPL